MISFRTEIHTPPSELIISHQTPLLFIGSCFTENIGRKLEELAFPVLINPTGIVYNPLSVKKSLEILAEGKEFTGKDLVMRNDQYFSYDHDTSFSHPEMNTCLERINSAIQRGRNHLEKASVILLTFGTAWVYYLKDQKIAVSNCHKIPSAEFVRKLLSVEEMVTEFTLLIHKLIQINPAVKFIFTISPVRHWKDGAVGNQISKSSLVLAVHRIIEKFPDVAEYFPAFEIMLDDLRDYRFYGDDLLHPSAMAVDYLWEKFAGVYFKGETPGINKEIASLSAAANHRPFNIHTPAWNQFVSTNLKKIVHLKEKHPFLDLSFYEEYFSR
jgi:hypothetical protein